MDSRELPSRAEASFLPVTTTTLKGRVLDLEDQSELGIATARAAAHLMELIYEHGFADTHPDDGRQFSGTSCLVIAVTPEGEDYEVHLGTNKHKGYQEGVQLYVIRPNRSGVGVYRDLNINAFTVHGTGDSIFSPGARIKRTSDINEIELNSFRGIQLAEEEKIKFLHGLEYSVVDTDETQRCYDRRLEFAKRSQEFVDIKGHHFVSWVRDLRMNPRIEIKT